MKKIAYVCISYLDTISPEDVGLSDDCSTCELELAAYRHWSKLTDEISDMVPIPFCPNDIEVQVNEEDV